MDAHPGLASRICIPGSCGRGKPRANEEDQRMIATSLTADAEIRHLRKLGEATHDWCEPSPYPLPPTRSAATAVAWRAVGAAVQRILARFAGVRTTANVPAPEGGAR
jgi:hypothetical protein